MNTIKRKNKIIASLLMFFFYAAFGTVVPIYNLLFQAKGFNLGVISVLLLIPRIMSVIAGPLWAAVADFFKLHRRLLSFAMFLSIPFIIFLRYANNLSGVLFIYALYAFCTSPLIPLTDNAVVTLLGDEKSDFGKLRVWGAVSFGLSAFLVGFLTDMIGIEIAYWAYTIFMIITVGVAWMMPEQPEYVPVPFWKGLGLILKDNRWIGLILGAVMMGFSQVMIINYLTRYLKDLGATGSMIGTSIIVATLSEIPVFLFSTNFLKRIPGRKLIQIALFVLSIRCFGYSLVKDPLFVYFIQPLNGLTYALFWAAAVIYIRELAPKGFNASAQALVAAAFFGIGGILGAFGGGQLYILVGPSKMFLIGSMGALLGFIVFTYFTYKKD